MDDDVAVGQRAVHRVLDRVGRRVALADRRAGRDADHHVRELPARGLPHPQPPQLDPRSAPIAASAASCASDGTRSISTSMLTLHQPSRGEQHEPGHEQRGRRVGPVIARPRGDEAEQHGRRAGEVAGEVERVRLQRGLR